MEKNTGMRRPAFTQKWLFQKLLLRILNNWIWIVIPVIAALTIAFLVNRYQDAVYASSLQVIKGQVESSGTEEIAYMFGVDRQRRSLNIQYERAFFTSKDIMQEVVKALDLNITYYSKGRIKTAERYGTMPVKLVVDEDSERIPYNVMITIIPAEDHTFFLQTEDEYWQAHFINMKFNFGEAQDINGWKFTLNNGGSLESGDWIFKIQSVESVAQSYKWAVNINLVNSYSSSPYSIMQLSMQSTLPHKDRMILDKLLEEIEKADIERKIEQTNKTIDFIEDQLQVISDSMMFIAGQVRSLKLSNSELIAGSQTVFGKITNLEEQKTELLLMNKYCDYLDEYIANSLDEDIIAPSTFGINSDVLGGLVSNYITLQLEIREIASKDLSSSVLRKEILQKERQRAELEGLIVQSIENAREANKIRIREYERQVDILFTAARSVMGEEIVLADFERLYGLNETVFTMLMNKKTEAGIKRSSMVSDYSSFEVAKTSGVPIRPQSSRNYMQALMLGLLIPIAILFLLTINNNTILSLAELEELVKMPVVGVIGFSRNSRTMIEAPKSLVSENFRSLRANLRYASGDKDKLTFVVTSSVSAEGKTYISSNMAASMAFQDKKTVLIGADLRKPTLHNYFDMSHDVGLSHYLIGEASLDQIIQSGGTENLHVIFSGPVPPNPAELLSGRRMKELMVLLKQQYDVIFIDTPPIGLISDASEIFPIADRVLMVTRQQKTPVSTLQHIEHFIDEDTLKKTMLIFNSVKKGIGYGYYGYGYGYGYGTNSEYYTVEK